MQEEKVDLEKNPELKQVMTKMCEIIGIEIGSVDFDNPLWYDTHSWTVDQEMEFLFWLVELLIDDESVRTSLLEEPENCDMESCMYAGSYFISMYGWNTIEDDLDDLTFLEETK